MPAPVPASWPFCVIGSGSFSLAALSLKQPTLYAQVFGLMGIGSPRSQNVLGQHSLSWKTWPRLVPLQLLFPTCCGSPGRTASQKHSEVLTGETLVFTHSKPWLNPCHPNDVSAGNRSAQALTPVSHDQSPQGWDMGKKGLRKAEGPGKKACRDEGAMGDVRGDCDGSLKPSLYYWTWD